jgi:alpha-beta hydrolase superfamily lysophospholipase
MSNFFYSGQYKIHFHYFEAEKNNAVIILIHGMGEHLGRYSALAKQFNQYNYAVCAYDQYGHGLSDGKRGDLPSLSFMYDTLDIFLDKVKSDFPKVPVILYGHSMGGNVLANFLIRKQPKVNAAILSSPWFKLPTKPPVLKLMLAKIMNYIYPSYLDRTNLDALSISRDHEVVKNYLSDPLVHAHITPRFFLRMNEAANYALDHADKISVPFLIFNGTNDALTCVQGSLLFANSNKRLGTLKLYEGGFHELHNDDAKYQLFDDILDWLASNVLYK